MAMDNQRRHKMKSQDQIEIYRQLRRIRTFEERVGELYVRQQSAGSMIHLSIGEESAAVGVCSAMIEGDSFTTHHRGHGIFLARGADPKRMMAEIAGKESGYCRGKGGSMHIADRKLGHLGANAIVGGGIPAVVGAGLSFRRQKNGNVAIAFFGDGAMQQGILYESMNLAALWRLPVLFVCVNNQWGMGTRIDQAAASLAFDQRARGFGLTARVLNGVDVGEVIAAANELVSGARKGLPTFMSIDCYRFYGHGRMDKSPYRTPEEEAEGRQQDPIIKIRAALEPEQTAALDQIDRETSDEMNAALEFAIAAARPAIESMFEDVFGPDQPPPQTRAERLNEILG